VRLDVDGETLLLEKRGSEFWVTMDDPDWKAHHIEMSAGPTRGSLSNNVAAPRVQKRVTLMTGSHSFQAYWVAGDIGNTQYALPIAWLISEKRWVPRKDSFIRDPDGPPLSQVWNVNCIKCHSTGGQPRSDSLSGAMETRVGEMGIACEACHGPAETHVALNHSPIQRYIRHFSGKGDASIVNPLKLDAKASTDVCAQCHSYRWNLFQKDWLREGFSFRPGDDLEKTFPLLRGSKISESPWVPESVKHDPEILGMFYWPDGMIRITGREYNGLIESACHVKGGMTCLSCHSMHQSEPNDQLATNMESNRACLQCHEAIGEKLSEHTHHGPQSSGSSCYNCHMPLATYGLLRSVRNHFIEIPSASKTVETGRPNGCTLCHLDKPLQWTADYLTKWYNSPTVQLDEDEQRISSPVLMALRGNAAQRALVAAAFGWKPAREISGQDWIAPHLVDLMDDPYSAVRFIAFNSLRQNPHFQDLNFDYVGPPEGRAAARENALKKWGKLTSKYTDDSVLIQSNGLMNTTEISRLRKMRDNRKMNLSE
jgi:predicted CXXCH cytochrome family protein